MRAIFKLAFATAAMLPLASCQTMEFDEPGGVDALKTAAMDSTPPIEITETNYTTEESLKGGNYRLENVSVAKDASLTIDADGYVQIDGNFSVELGSSLTIN